MPDVEQELSKSYYSIFHSVEILRNTYGQNREE